MTAHKLDAARPNGGTAASLPRRSALALGVLAGLLQVTQTATAQESVAQNSNTGVASTANTGGIEELVVRARNRVENQQDVPISMSVVRWFP